MNTGPNKKFIEEYTRLNKTYGIRIFSKNNKWVWIWKILNIFSFIIQTKKDPRKISEKFTTAWGKYIFFPDDWKIEESTLHDYITLKHEEIHIKWYLNMGLGSIWLGYILFCLLYSFCFLPIGLAYFRYASERIAYVESYNEGKKVGIYYDVNDLVNNMTGSAYFWAWPFKTQVRKYFNKHCR